MSSGCVRGGGEEWRREGGRRGRGRAKGCGVLGWKEGRREGGVEGRLKEVEYWGGRREGGQEG